MMRVGRLSGDALLISSSVRLSPGSRPLCFCAPGAVSARISRNGASLMDIFAFRDHLVGDYETYLQSFLRIRNPNIRSFVDEKLHGGALWPEPLIQLNPAFEAGDSIDQLVADQILHTECARIFRLKKAEGDWGIPLRLHRHQSDAVRVAASGENYILTTGTGSGKSLAYIVPIVDRVLRRGSGNGIQAIVVYPMNALANSQCGELTKFLEDGYGDGQQPVTFARYTGQEGTEERNRILAKPPDILLTNYVMLELILTRPDERQLVGAARGLSFLVFDELHTYRGRQGADVALLVRRVREALELPERPLQCVGTSATLARGSGGFAEQRREVATVATEIFGTPVHDENVVVETLRRVTPHVDVEATKFLERLARRVSDPGARPPQEYGAFVACPLSGWIESTFGIARDETSGRYVRRSPRRIGGPQGAAEALSRLTGVAEDQAVSALRAAFLAGYECKQEVSGAPAFAFRLHQFISRGDAVYATVERDETRYLTLNGQQISPKDKESVLFPLVFCRECGHEYYTVRGVRGQDGQERFVRRDLAEGDVDDTDDASGRRSRIDAGFLYLSDEKPWPASSAELIERLPDDWIEDANGAPRIRPDRTKNLPQLLHVSFDGRYTASPIANGASRSVVAHFVPAPLRFCLCCGVSYGSARGKDFSRLASLDAGGRSTATTILALSTISSLRNDPELKATARKLLSFTDNRQDASLQAGHFNDFVDVGLVRAALYQAVVEAHADGREGLRHDELTQRVDAALALSPIFWATNPDARYAAATEMRRAFRNVLGYRLYRDLRRGWRITSPNLEQCGLLEIRYPDLEDVCADAELWQSRHAALAGASPNIRVDVTRVLLDVMRRSLAIKVDYLDPDFQDRLKQQSGQHLIAPWSIDEGEQMERTRHVLPRSRSGNESREDEFLSSRTGFGQYVGRRLRNALGRPLKLTDKSAVIQDILDVLVEAGMVEKTARERRGRPEGNAYRLLASTLLWTAADGTRTFYDPIRVPQLPEELGEPNAYFKEFYQSAGRDLHGMEAHEHTAQVPSEERQRREHDFAIAKLPVMFCSPTMELGVDISELNIVNMRNMPPTPANYAQRSGRAGRSGQPALVFTYCTSGSSHDQYFFKRPERMVAGAVTPPRLDLANEDLVRAHIHAIWLAETQLPLGRSLREILDVESTGTGEPTLALQARVRDHIHSGEALLRARVHGLHVLDALREPLADTDWCHDPAQWLDRTLERIGERFDEACDRWRDLYRAALRQAKAQDEVIRNAAAAPDAKKQAERLRREAEEQMKLLIDVENVAQSDFYSYRYLAGEGFLPGYNFPRLPLSAFIPARRSRQRDEFLSRPRFLAISEFGPRAIIYHEGSRYQIDKVILPLSDPDRLRGDGVTIPTSEAKICPACGYLHHVDDAGGGVDLCESCGAALTLAISPLFRMQNVGTRRRESIHCDEEERMRFGYEIATSVRFAEIDGVPSRRMADALENAPEPIVLARLRYGPAATIWRINLGLARRRQRDRLGFVLDVNRGYWAKSNDDPAEPDDDDYSPPTAARTMRVIPFVEDRRNCLFLTPTGLTGPAMASLEAALKNALQIEYQMEDSELAAEPLPRRDDRRLILFYEAAEGGAGALRRLIDDPDALARVARRALELCHFDPDTGEDRRRAESSSEDCVRACYDCLMHYGNQRDHMELNRHDIRDFLLRLARTSVRADAPPAATREIQAAELGGAATGPAEELLAYLVTNGHRLPTGSGAVLEAPGGARPDFIYRVMGATPVAVYVDGAGSGRDEAAQEALEDAGWLVIRFGAPETWPEVLARNASVFGAAVR
jgi:superfamily II DNA/RNA helicase